MCPTTPHFPLGWIWSNSMCSYKFKEEIKIPRSLLTNGKRVAGRPREPSCQIKQTWKNNHRILKSSPHPVDIMADDLAELKKQVAALQKEVSRVAGE